MRGKSTTSWSFFLLPLLILLLAALVRLIQLPTLPPGLNFDEAGNGIAALEILRGEGRLWWRIGGGKEPLWPYLIAMSTTLLGNIPLAVRLPAALVGILSVAVVYSLTSTLFRACGRSQARQFALLAMLSLSLSAWHLHFSRLGFRAILLPLLSSLAFYFLWQVLASDQSWLGKQARLKFARNLLLSALFLALTIYAYLAGRLLPLVPILFSILQWATIRLKRSVEPSPTSTSRYLLFTGYCLLPTLFFLLPLLIYFTANPADFVARSGAVSIFNPEWNNGDLWGTLWRTLTLTLGTFIGLTGDANPLVNLPHQSAIPPVLAPFFLLGLLTSFYHLFRPPSPISQSPPPPSPHLFLLAWWLVMLLPAILAPEGAPHHLRLIGTLIPSTIFIALGLVTIINLLQALLRSTQYATSLPSLLPTPYSLLLTGFFLLLTFQTMTNYFARWPAAADFTLPFDLYALELAAEIDQAPPEVGYVLPMDIRAAAEARHYTLDYLLGDQSAAYTYLPVDERNAEKLLSQAAKRKSELRVVRWREDKHLEADEKEIVTFLLAQQATLTQRENRPIYDLEVYRLADSPAVFSLPRISQPMGVNFDGLLRLDAAFVAPQARPGTWLPVAITLAPLVPLEVDYKASVRLLSATGERLLQKDRILKHNFHQGTSLWPPETVNEYYLLPVSPVTPPGDYTVALVIYHPDTQVPLIDSGVVEVPLGATHIE